MVYYKLVETNLLNEIYFIIYIRNVDFFYFLNIYLHAIYIIEYFT